MASSTMLELLGKVLEDQEAEGVSGAGDARDRLARRAKGSSTPATAGSPGVKPAAAATPAAPVGYSMGARAVRRPNGDEYFVRRVRHHDDVALVQAMREENVPLLLYGGPGCGKTALFEAAFTNQETLEPLFEFVPGDGDTKVSDFTGGYVPQPDGSFFWVDGPLTRACELGLPLLVDEVALINPKVMAVVYSAMDGRTVLRITDNPDREDVVIKPGFFVVGACNPNAPGARMSEALLSRFLLHVEVAVDFNMVRDVMGVDAKFVTACANLFAKYTERSISWYPAIREMLGYQKLKKLLGQEVALANVVSQAPELDRKEIADVLSRAFGGKVANLELK